MQRAECITQRNDSVSCSKDHFYGHSTYHISDCSCAIVAFVTAFSPAAYQSAVDDKDGYQHGNDSTCRIYSSFVACR